MADDQLGRVVLDVEADASGYDRTLDAAQSKAEGFTGRVRKSFDGLKASLSTGFKQGLGIGAGIGAVGAVTDAVRGAVTYMTDAIQMAREEEAGIAGLNASLRENAKGWDGTTEAIERTIKAQQDQFAFSDGDQREALSRLVAVTGDTETAMDRMRLAMDLARLRGIDLATASDIVGKVHGGNIGILSRYGIQLGRGTTSTEALAKIQEMAAGQAEAYGESSAGAADSAGMAFEDLQEDIGRKLLPALTEIARFLRDVLVPAFSWLVENVLGPVIDGIGNLAQSFRDAAGDVHFFAMNFGDQGDRVHEMADKYGETFDDLKDRIRDRMVESGESFEEAADHITSEMEGARLKVREDAWGMMQDVLSAAVQGRQPIEDEWDGVTGYLPAAIKERWAEVRANAQQAMVEYYMGIYDEESNLRAQVEAVIKAVEEELTPAQKIAFWQGQLVALEHARGIALQKGNSTAAVDSMIAVIQGKLGELTGQGFSYGYNLGAEYARGIERSANFGGVVRTAAGKLAQAVTGQIGIRSEPEDRDSPLRGITKWGGNIVKTIVDDMLSHVGDGARAAGALAAALVPNLSIPAVTVPAMAGVGSGIAATATGTGGVTNQWILNVEGVPRVIGTRQQAIEELDRIGATWG